MKRPDLKYLTILRAIAALWVVIHHGHLGLSVASVPTSNMLAKFIYRGWLGVDLFFILSGYLLALNYQEKMSRFNLTSFKTFLVNRFSRIYPAHLFTLSLYALLVSCATFFGLFNDPLNKFNAVDFWPQIFLMHGIGHIEPNGWNLPTWSVSSEAFAYLLFPFLILPFSRLSKVSVNLILILAIISTNVILAAYLNADAKFMLDFGFTWVRVLSEFVMGMSLFQISKSFNQSRRYIILAIISFILIFFQGAIESSSYDFMYLIYFMTLIHSLALTPSPKKHSLFSAFGEISYSLYLIHSLVIIMLNQLIKILPSPGNYTGTLFLTYLVVSQILAWIMYHWVEMPARTKLKSILVRKTKEREQLEIISI